MSCNFSHRFFVTVVIYVIFRVYVAKKITLTLTLTLLLSLTHEHFDIDPNLNLIGYLYLNKPWFGLALINLGLT